MTCISVLQGLHECTAEMMRFSCDDLAGADHRLEFLHDRSDTDASRSLKTITHNISGGCNGTMHRLCWLWTWHWIWHNKTIWSLCQRKFSWETWDVRKIEVIKSPRHTRRSKSEIRLTYISARQVIFELSHFHFAGSLSELLCFHFKFHCFRKSCTKCLFCQIAWS